MFSFVIYELKVAVIMTVFYLFYRVMLSRETLHRLNRAVLMATVLVSFVLPFCVITIHRTVEVSDTLETINNQPITDTFLWPSVNADAMMIRPGSCWWKVILITIYLVGVAWILTKTIRELVSVRRVIRQGEQHLQEDGSVVVILDKEVSPFSWMKWIVLSRKDYESGNRHILMHEKAHIKLGHAWDVLIIDLLSSMQWFNPAMWYLRSDLRAIFEYEADDAVLRQGANIKEYQYSLIRKAVSASGYSITNSFNHSILKNRITMMSKSKSAVSRGLRAFYILPLLAAVLACNAKTKTEYKVNENQEISTSSDVDVSQAVISIRKDSSGDAFLYVNDKRVSLDEIGAEVKVVLDGVEFPMVTIQSEPDINMGCIADIKNELRKVNVLKICYDIPGNSSVTRRLPPTPEYASENGVKVISSPNNNSANIHRVFLNSLGRIMIDSEIVEVSALESRLKKIVEEQGVVGNSNKLLVFLLTHDRATPAGKYVAVHDIFSKVYQDVRADYAVKKYGKSIGSLPEEQYQAILKDIPLSVMEVE